LVAKADIADSMGLDIFAPEKTEGRETVVEGDPDDRLGGEDGLVDYVGEIIPWVGTGALGETTTDGVSEDFLDGRN
jgi:hypothetical protein